MCWESGVYTISLFSHICKKTTFPNCLSRMSNSRPAGRMPHLCSSVWFWPMKCEQWWCHHVHTGLLKLHMLFHDTSLSLFICWLNVHYLVCNILERPSGIGEPLNRRSLDLQVTVWGRAVQERYLFRNTCFCMSQWHFGIVKKKKRNNNIKHTNEHW